MDKTLAMFASAFVVFC